MFRAAVLVCACVALGGRGAAGAPPALDPEMAELAAMVRESCAGETGVDLALVERVNAGAPLSPDAALKCYIKCVMETAGMFSDGVVDVDALLQILPPDMGAANENVFRSCGTKPGTDHCDTAYLTQLCWQTSNPKDFFLI